jgi:hypothetical protein
MTEPTSLIAAVDNLPADSITVKVLNALDFVIPGEWRNVVGFDKTVQDALGGPDPTRVQQIRQRAQELFQTTPGYQRALTVYRLVDATDTALAAAAMANKLGEQFAPLSFLTSFTPKADTTQAIDLAVKMGAEILGYTFLQGGSGVNFQQFLSGLANYANASRMRLAAWVALDGLVPLGPDFLREGLRIVNGLKPSQLDQSATFLRLRELIPGAPNALNQLRFVQDGLNTVQGWTSGFIADRGLTPQKVFGSINRFIDVSDTALDYVGAFLDAATDYMAHTGTQSVARHVIQRAAG